jgi:hypothetical protein
MDMCITIRTCVIANGTAYLQAGAGIVADSVPEREYEECLHKIGALHHALELAAGMSAEGGGGRGVPKGASAGAGIGVADRAAEDSDRRDSATATSTTKEVPA